MNFRSKLECKQLSQELSQHQQWQDLIKLKTMKVMQDSLEVLNHFGEDKFHIQLLSSLHSKRLSHISMQISSQSQRVNIQRQHNL
jgi:hypothetical protein